MSPYSMKDIVKSVEIQYITIGTIVLKTALTSAIHFYSLARMIDSAPVGVNIHIFKYSDK